MTDLPENIWTWAFVSAKQNEFMTGGWHDEPEPHPTGKETKYIRYEKHTGYLAGIKAAFGEACDQISEYKEQREVDKARIKELEEALGEFARFASRKEKSGASVPFGQSKLHAARATLKGEKT